MKQFQHNYKFFNFFIAFLVFAALATTVFWSHAQTTQQQPQQNQQNTNPQQQRPTPTQSPTPSVSPTATPTPEGKVIDESDEPIRVETELVNLNVRIVDRNGRSVNDVRPDEFKVFEDGVQQKIEFVSREDVPVNYGLVVDNSGSLRSQLSTIQDAAKIIIAANKPDDATFVIRFTSSDKIEILKEFTKNKQELNDAVDDMFPQGGQTAVVDAVMLAAEKAAEYEKGKRNEDKSRRALILITDGEDRDSFYKEEDLFRQLREADVQIYPIGFVNELEKGGGFISKSPREKAVKLLERMAQETGGRAYFPNSLDELAGIANSISSELRTQYLLSYAPTNDKRDGTYRSIRVTVNDDPKRGRRIPVTRTGRTAPKA